MKYIYALLVLLLALFLAAFIQQNGVGIQLRYFSWSTPHLPLSLYMILSFAAGYVLAVVVGFTSGLRFRFRASGAEKELRQLRGELEQLKKEEIEAVRSEFPPDSKDPKDPENPEDSGKLSLASETNSGSEDGSDEDQPGNEHDPDAETVFTGSRQEEDK